MAYADQTMSGNKIIAIIIVALIHIAVGYVLVTGLAYQAAKTVIERVTTIDIDDAPPPPEEDIPPPPQQEAPPPPIVAPPPPINVSVAPPQIVTVTEPPPPAPVVPRIVPAPPAPPAPPPPPRVQPKNPEPRGRPQSWVTNNDYPSRAMREERQGTTRFTLTIGTDGRVTNCTVTGSSGHADLDNEVCRLMSRRARFNAATDGEGQPTTGTWSSAFRWEIPR